MNECKIYVQKVERWGILGLINDENCLIRKVLNCRCWLKMIIFCDFMNEQVISKLDYGKFNILVFVLMIVY